MKPLIKLKTDNILCILPEDGGEKAQILQQKIDNKANSKEAKNRKYKLRWQKSEFIFSDNGCECDELTIYIGNKYNLGQK